MWSAIVSRLLTTTPRSRAESTILTTHWAQDVQFADRESVDIVPRAQPQYLGLGRIQTQSACSHPHLYVSKTTREPVDSTLNVVYRRADVVGVLVQSQKLASGDNFANLSRVQDKQQGAQNLPSRYPV